MKRSSLVLAALLATLPAVPAVASIPELPEVSEREASGFDPRSMVGYRKCEITEVKAERTVIVWDELDRAHYELQLSPKVKLRAVSKSQFDGRKKLAFEDLDVGQRIKLKYAKTDMKILQVSVLPADAE